MYREAFVNILNTQKKSKIKTSTFITSLALWCYCCFVRLYLNERELEFLVAFYMHFYILL